MGRTVYGTYVIDVNGISVTVVRTQVKRINLRLSKDGMRMSIPRRCSLASAEQFARQNEDWMRATLAKSEMRSQAENDSWEDGTHTYVWGKRVPVRVRVCEGQRDCSLEDGALILHVHADDEARIRAELVEWWRRNQIVERLRDLLPQVEARVGRSATSITLRRMKTRWGSCTPKTGRIRLNVALSEYPPECLEGVLVHELCHLWEPNHGPRFYALMDLHFPSWRATQRILKAGHLGATS